LDVELAKAIPDPCSGLVIDEELVYRVGWRANASSESRLDPLLRRPQLRS
jgi:hypothetical protein